MRHCLVIALLLALKLACGHSEPAPAERDPPPGAEPKPFVVEVYQVADLVTEDEPEGPQPVEPLEPEDLLDLLFERLEDRWGDDWEIEYREGGTLTFKAPAEAHREVREILEEVRITRR